MARDGFSRLRVAAAVGTAGVVAVPALAPHAAAGVATMHMPAAHSSDAHSGSISNHAVWDVANDLGGPFGPTVGAGLHDVSLYSQSSTASPSTKHDAFDVFGLVRVQSGVYADPDGSVTLPDSNTYVTSPRSTGGLKTSIQYRFFGVKENVSIVRVLVTLKNTKASTVKKTVSIGTRFGEGGATSVHDTSDGDANVEPIDSWYQIHGTAARPSALVARGDKGIGIVDNDPGGTGIEIDTYHVRVGAHKTTRLLYYAVIGMYDSAIGTSVKGMFSTAAALHAATFKGSSLLDGLPATTRKQIKNWNGL